MSPEEFKLMAPLVDVQPVYNVMHIARGDGTYYPPELTAYVRMKLLETAKSLRETAKHIEKQLRSSPDKSEESKGGNT